MHCARTVHRQRLLERQVPLPVVYKSIQLDCEYRLDFLVEKAVVLEIKTVESLQRIHEAQLLTYMKLGGWPIGLLINFNVPILTKGIKRMVNNLKPSANSGVSAVKSFPLLYPSWQTLYSRGEQITR